LEYKLKAKVAENEEEEIKNGINFGPITTEWMFSTLKDRHYEPAGQPITRLTGQLNDLNNAIWKELGLGVRTPEGVCHWLGRKRRELKSSSRNLTNREMCDYFRGSNIVKSHKLNNVIVHHCLSVDFIKKVDFGEPEVFQDEFAMGLGKIDEFLDAETPCKQFGPSGVYDATKTNWGNLGK